MKTDSFTLEKHNSQYNIAVSAKENLDKILTSNQALHIVRNMPTTQILLLISEVGINDCAELLQLISSNQAREIIDFAAWHKYQISYDKIGMWLYNLYLANKQRAVAHFRALDIELISLLFKSHTRIYEIEEGNYPDDIGYVTSTTPDGRYYIVFDGDKQFHPLFDFLSSMLKELYASDMSFALKLVESLKWETSSYLQEESFKWRQNRMMDLGFASLDDVAKIISFVDPDTILAGKAKNSLRQNPNLANSDSKSLLFEVHQFNRYKFLQKAYSKLNSCEQEIFLQHLAITFNRVLQAYECDFSDKNKIISTKTMVLNYIEMALAYLSHNGEKDLQYIIEQLPAQELFRCGNSIILKISRQFKTFLANNNFAITKDDLNLLDFPLREVVAAILQKQPNFFTGLTESNHFEFRCFANLNEALITSKTLLEAMFRAALMGDKGLKSTNNSNKKNSHICHGSLLATWLCHYLLNKKPQFTPLSNLQLNRINKLLVKNNARLSFSKATKEQFNDLLYDKAKKFPTLPSISSHKELKQKICQYIDIVLLAVEREFYAFKGDEIDGKYIKSLVTIDNC